MFGENQLIDNIVKVEVSRLKMNLGILYEYCICCILKFHRFFWLYILRGIFKKYTISSTVL
mgnify:CR=1 FL=1